MISVNIDIYNVCLSGGADGSDLLWGYCAGKNNHMVVHWSYEYHKTQAPETEVVRLNKEHLEKADPFLEDANKTLKRKLNYNSSYINLLRRNYYQIRDTSKVYLISTLNKNNFVNGGTAWAVQMYIDRVYEENIYGEMYMYEQNLEKWLEYDFVNNKWKELETRPPFPKEIWTGIGTRKLSINDKNEIKSLMGLD